MPSTPKSALTIENLAKPAMQPLTQDIPSLCHLLYQLLLHTFLFHCFVLQRVLCLHDQTWTSSPLPYHSRPPCHCQPVIFPTPISKEDRWTQLNPYLRFHQALSKWFCLCYSHSWILPGGDCLSSYWCWLSLHFTYSAFISTTQWTANFWGSCQAPHWFP